jgi:hypothetical protein
MKTAHVACFLALVLLSLSVVNCGRDEFPDDDGLNQDTTNTDFHYSGSVVVPENYPGDVNDLVIISNTDSVGVWDGDYTVLVDSQVSDFHPLYVTNQFGEIVMMGYNTGQKNFNKYNRYIYSLRFNNDDPSNSFAVRRRKK